MEHDNSYKLLFTHPEMVTDLLKGFINEPWIEQCDFSTLEKMGGSYVTDDIRDREDDIIWRIRYEFEIQDVLAHLIVWLKDPAQSSLRRTFTVWINRVLLPTKSPSANYPELNDLNEVHTMLAERVKEWVEEWKEAGRQEGQLEARQEGRQEEASKLFLLLLESKFGSVNQQIQNKVSVASIELIESWSKQIFEATTPEDLLNS